MKSRNEKNQTAANNDDPRDRAGYGALRRAGLRTTFNKSRGAIFSRYALRVMTGARTAAESHSPLSHGSMAEPFCVLRSYFAEYNLLGYGLALAE